MLRQLSIQNRSPSELRQLAGERREQAVSRNGSIRALLLKEAKLLEFQAELKAWVEWTDLDQQSAGPSELAAEGRQPMQCELAPLLDRLSSRMALSLGD